MSAQIRGSSFMLLTGGLVLLTGCLGVLAGCDEGPQRPLVPDRFGSPAPEGASEDEDWDLEKHWGSVPFADSEIFFEFNATDDDLGVQIFLDGEPWRRVRTTDPLGHRILDFAARGRLRALGITELRFESAEPSPAEVLALFPQGEYRFRGETVDGLWLEGEGELSHELPPAPVVTPSQGEQIDPVNLVVQWQPIAGMAGFQLIVADEEAGTELTVDLPGDVTSLRIPQGFLEAGTEYKVEVLAIAENGNKTITEGTFVTMP